VQRLFKCPGVIPTFALGFNRPIADTPPGLDTWRGIPGVVGFPNRWQFIDEATPNDTDYISQGLGNAGSIYSVSLGAPVVTVGVTSVTVRVRARSMGGTNPLNFTFNYDLIRGAFGFSSVGNVLTTNFATLSHTLTPVELANFLAQVGTIEVLVHGSGGPGTDAFEVSWIEVEID